MIYITIHITMEPQRLLHWICRPLPWCHHIRVARNDRASLLLRATVGCFLSAYDLRHFVYIRTDRVSSEIGNLAILEGKFWRENFELATGSGLKFCDKSNGDGPESLTNM